MITRKKRSLYRANAKIAHYKEEYSYAAASYIIANFPKSYLILNYAPYQDDIVGNELRKAGFSVVTYDPYKENPLHDPYALTRQYELVFSEFILNRQSSIIGMSILLADLVDCVRPKKFMVLTTLALLNRPSHNKIERGRKIVRRMFKKSRLRNHFPLQFILARSPHEYSGSVSNKGRRKKAR